VTIKTIAHYEITGPLGEGGMGIVYAARTAASVSSGGFADILNP